MHEFWNWFAANKDRIAAAMISGDDDAREFAMDAVNERLQRVAPGVWFLFGDHGDDYELCVSADGQREAFPAVQALVAAAPAIAGWRVVAFRPPLEPGFELRMGDVTLSTDDVQFRTFDLEGGGLGITLYPRGMTEAMRDQFTQAAVVMLDHVVGEYDAAMKIDSLSVEPPTSAQPASNSPRLSELRTYLMSRAPRQ